MLLEGIWSNPIIDLKKGEGLIWTEPLSKMLSLHGKEVTHKNLEGAIVKSEMAIAVVPDVGNYINGNSTKTSNEITIPVLNTK